MELKNYQKDTIQDLERFLEFIDRDQNIIQAWKNYWGEKDIKLSETGIPFYRNNFPGTPHVCFKVPTGGGKTFMACASIKKIFDHMSKDKPRVVVWLVPSDPILKQTIKALSNPSHPYRQRLDRDNAGKVCIYTKQMLLSGQNFTPDTVKDNLSVCVMTYASLKIDSSIQDIRKAYQENGNLFRFTDNFQDKDLLLEDTPDTALMQVLRQFSPVCINDEGHNAGSVLSMEMLKVLNPSFILELTATPKSTSNILSYVDAFELKKCGMVKLPVMMFKKNSRISVLQDAITLRASLEKQAKEAGSDYIRPIVLFQAQPKSKDDAETYEKIKEKLMEIGIPKDEIGIKVSGKDTIGDTDLLSPTCHIRYIITVNALKEGWDCPFAYILASLANKTSQTDVEQIVGRVLRQPYTKKSTSPLLNASYVFTCSDDFRYTLNSILKGLNKAGYSKKDYRIVQDASSSDESDQAFDQFMVQEQMVISEEELTFSSTEDTSGQTGNTVLDDLSDFDSITEDTISENNNPSLQDVLTKAEETISVYEEEVKQADESVFTGGIVGDMLNQNPIQEQFREEMKDFKLPQFYVQTTPNIFGDEYALLEPENLSEGFSLKGCDAHIDFSLDTGETYSVDLYDEGTPKYRSISKTEGEYFRRFLETLPPEKRVKKCADEITAQLNKSNTCSVKEVSEYVNTVISRMSDDELEAMETSIPTYSGKIKDKIKSLENSYRKDMFFRWLDSGKIVCRESYQLPSVITPSETIDSIPNSLYEAEWGKLDSFEHKVLDVLVASEKIKWWHRIIEKKDFHINGYIKDHYPDFMAMTKSGRILLIEAKGDYLDGSDSESKINLGKKWEMASSQLGRIYKYFMVFEKNGIQADGVYNLDGFQKMLKDMV